MKTLLFTALVLLYGTSAYAAGCPRAGEFNKLSKSMNSYAPPAPSQQTSGTGNQSGDMSMSSGNNTSGLAAAGQCTAALGGFDGQYNDMDSDINSNPECSKEQKQFKKDKTALAQKQKQCADAAGALGDQKGKNDDNKKKMGEGGGGPPPQIPPPPKKEEKPKEPDHKAENLQCKATAARTRRSAQTTCTTTKDSKCNITCETSNPIHPVLTTSDRIPIQKKIDDCKTKCTEDEVHCKNDAEQDEGKEKEICDAQYPTGGSAK